MRVHWTAVMGGRPRPGPARPPLGTSGPRSPASGCLSQRNQPQQDRRPWPPRPRQRKPAEEMRAADAGPEPAPRRPVWRVAVDSVHARSLPSSTRVRLGGRGQMPRARGRSTKSDSGVRPAVGATRERPPRAGYVGVSGGLWAPSQPAQGWRAVSRRGLVFERPPSPCSSSARGSGGTGMDRARAGGGAGQPGGHLLRGV